MASTRSPGTQVKTRRKIAALRQALAVGKTRWAMLALMFGATALNYIDRASLGILQPILSSALGWTTMDYANINFWFQAGYAVGYFGQGMLIDRFGVRRVFFVAVLLWSIAIGAHAFATTVAGFMVCRLILGFSEGANYPAGVKISSVWFPAQERAVAAGLFNAGTHVGAVITPVLLPWILTTWGWRAVFIVIGCLGLSWAFVWLQYYFDPEKHEKVSAKELAYIRDNEERSNAKVPIYRALMQRGTWAFVPAFTLTAPVFWFYLYWLPPFLHQHYSLGISVTQIGPPLIIIYVMADIGSIGGGLLSSFLITRGMRPVNARLATMLLCALSVTSVAAANSSHLWSAVFAISLGLAAGQAWIANLYSLVMDFSPKSMTSTVFGFGGMCAAVGGMFMTQIVGYVLTVTHNNYQLLFASIPALYGVALVWLYFIAPRRPA
jgi:MFS transporter, ACS family, hexuronate transporter